MNFYEHHLGDFAEATAHLTFVEDAAYSRLIRKYYSRELPIPADLKAAQRLIGARTKEELAAVEAVLNEFFTCQEDGWHNERCDHELTRYSEKREKARASAQVSVDVRRRTSAERTVSERSTDAQRTLGENDADSQDSTSGRSALQSPVSSHQSPVSNSKSADTRANGAVRSNDGPKPVGALLTQKPTLPGGVVLTPADLKRIKAAAESDKPRFPLKVPGRPDLDSTVPQPGLKASTRE